MSMLCVCISETTVPAVFESIGNASIAEIRLDYASFSLDEIEKIFSDNRSKKIATFRPGKVAEDHRQAMLIASINAGANWVDLEIENSSEFNAPVIEAARKASATVIVSYHNYELTPDISELMNIVEQGIKAGADIVKLACHARDTKDAARLLSLYDRNETLIVLGMGEHGKITRVTSPFLGAPFTFTAPDNGQNTAPGQFSYSRMQTILNNIGEQK
ncbi:MAG: type I 3-dehydroquinate dehydratase [Spirochaetes bacterium]|jgi:3-dehydroquinate dehydratase-1|nr:type I 3-dehydroquinate dehydratase [Spirochaetota bacterium]